MTKVMIIGDTHADDKFTANLNKCAKQLGVNTQVQLGDFGYSFDRNMIASIKAWLDRDPENKYYWIDGNHDQHDYIEEVILDNQGHNHWNDPVSHFHDRMFYCPRGSTAVIGDKKCLFLGGAFSIDKHMRKAHVSWWPQELIRMHDVDRAVENGLKHGPVDVMFSHDSPPTTFIEAELYKQGYKSDRDSTHNRRMVGAVVNEVHPQELYHGHYHWRYDTQYTGYDGWKVEVHGIGANTNGGWMDPSAVFDYNFVIRQW